jgi:hypothetical protein
MRAIVGPFIFKVRVKEQHCDSNAALHFWK